MGHEQPLDLTSEIATGMIAALNRHVTEEGILQDGSGWHFAECICGYETPRMPSQEDVADALMEHAYDVGRTAGRSGR